MWRALFTNSPHERPSDLYWGLFMLCLLVSKIFLLVITCIVVDIFGTKKLFIRITYYNSNFWNRFLDHILFEIYLKSIRHHTDAIRLEIEAEWRSTGRCVESNFIQTQHGLNHLTDFKALGTKRLYSLFIVVYLSHPHTKVRILR